MDGQVLIDVSVGDSIDMPEQIALPLPRGFACSRVCYAFVMPSVVAKQKSSSIGDSGGMQQINNVTAASNGTCCSSGSLINGTP